MRGTTMIMKTLVCPCAFNFVILGRIKASIFFQTGAPAEIGTETIR